MALKVVKFRATNFRSIVDSGWVELNDVTALVGINESGKSNLLLSLWKLNPAREGAIDAIADYPRERYNEIRAMDDKPTFITAWFSIDAELADAIGKKTGIDSGHFSVVEVSRDFDGDYALNFPEATVPREVEAGAVARIIDTGRRELTGVDSFQAEGDLKTRMLEAINQASQLAQGEQLDQAALAKIIETLEIDRSAAAKTSKISPVYEHVLEQEKQLLESISRPDPSEVKGIWELIQPKLPKFVYYSNYGNLDSEIYLPHVIANIKRTDLGEKEAAKTRTLKVLFEFVNLSPEEILELGKEVEAAKLTPQTIEADAKKKKEREILLTSASTQLTTKFRDWWKQGNYRFRFNADGNHFRIWVSDDVRPEEIELEGRSTGLQWFFSFYLVFLVESADAHQGTILLLDEAGLSLHPLAQRDLSAFFDSLENQIVYTTHSPFLMEADALDRVRSVFIDGSGRTIVSPDLRADPKVPSARKSIYAVHVALGLSVSDTFLYGCLPIVVEGVSDQRYLTAMKNYLIGRGKIQPNKDIVFLPAGGTGTKGVAAVVSIVAAKDESLPRVLLDSDKPGTDLKGKLLSGTYKGADDRVKQVADYGVVASGEVEDLIPARLLAPIVSRYIPRPPRSEEKDFEDVVDPKRPIVPQIEEYCQKHGLELNDGWKVEVANLFKGRLDKLEIDGETEKRWTAIFTDFLGA